VSEEGRAQVRAAIAAEGLSCFNWFEDRSPRAHEVGILQRSDGWLVYFTDERASWSRNGPTLHGDEDAALEDFLDRLRRLDRMIARWTRDPTTRPY
jgi:hypothetical protein